MYGLWSGYFRKEDASFMGLNRQTGWRGGRRFLREFGHGAYLVWNIGQVSSLAIHAIDDRQSCTPWQNCQTSLFEGNQPAQLLQLEFIAKCGKSPMTVLSGMRVR